ncbi:MAG: hypothetical protein JSS27_00290 [Planctomycetes bacterium]|nr:hypothetical protein [Planctomycetota bacterium]
MTWIAWAALTMILLEGVTLAVFPQQVKQLLHDVDPLVMQIAGALETLIAVGLLTALVIS